MGYDRHYALVITSFDQDAIAASRTRATELGLDLTDVITGTVNHWQTFLIGGSGSKIGWHDFADYQPRLSRMVDWLEQQRYDDGSTLLDYAFVRYGDDNEVASLLAASDETRLIGPDSTDALDLPRRKVFR